MIVKTRAILLKTVKYSENSVIARFYTEEFGLESFIINNIRSKKAAINASHMQPLCLLDADIYQRGNANLQRIKELRSYPILRTVYTEMSKTSVILFMQEALNKVIIEREQNTALFGFIFNTIQWLDTVAQVPAVFPSWWLVQLSGYLGFFPHTESWKEGYVFMPREGIFASQMAAEPPYINTENAQNVYQLCSTAINDLHALKINAQRRRELLDHLLVYYRLHIEGFGELKSHKILAEVLS